MRLIRILSALLVCSLMSCNYIAHINDQGSADSLQIQLNPIKHLTIEAPCKLVLTEQPLDHLTANGCDYILDGYRFINKGESLTITHKNGDYIQKEKMAEIRISCGIELTITANAPCIIATADSLNISKMILVFNGRGTYSESELNIKCTDFSLTSYGRASQTAHRIQGSSGNVHFHIEGSTTIAAHQFNAESVSVNHQSAGNCFVSAQKTLTANIYSTGNLYYKGSPTIDFKKHPSAYLTASGNIYRITD
jgi:hypothetical protein